MNKNLLPFSDRILMACRYVCLGAVMQSLLFTGFTTQGASVQNLYAVEINLRAEDKSLRDIFAMIEQQTEFNFSYSSKRVNIAQRVSLDGSHKNLGALLDYITRRTQLVFKQVNSILVVSTVPDNEVSHPQMGVLKGKVIDAQTQEVLPGATIVIKGTNVGTSSDVNGEFLLRVPVGAAEITISYIGYKPYSELVDIPAAGTLEGEFKLISDALQLQDIVITGVLQGQQRALNQQRAADNIKNVVSADQIGRFPDPNVAEALQRVPAVNIERDQGEGRYVLVRGLSPQFTNISINGEQIPSPEAGVRYVALDAIPADQLASIEVSKAITPDMDGDAIGGSVNLITRTAQTATPSISASVLGGYNNIAERSNFQGALAISKRFLDNRLGIMLNTSYYETDRGSENWERDDNDLELRDYTLLRTRLGMSSTIDYRFDDAHEIYFRTIYNRFTDREWRRRYIFVPNIDDSPFEDNAIERFTKDRLEKQIVTSFNIGAKHSFSKFNLDYEIAYAEAIQDTPFDIEIGSVGEVDDLSIDFETDSEYPSFAVNGLAHTEANNIYLDNSIYAFDELTIGNTYAKDVNKTGKFNLGIPYELGTGSGMIKAGAKVRLKEKSYAVTENVFDWVGGDVDFAGFATGDYTLEKYAGGKTNNYFLEGRYQIRANADDDKVIAHFNNNPSGYELNVDDKLAAEAVEAYQASEDVYAGYIMSKLQMHRLMVLAGVRYEFTQVKYASKEVVYDDDGLQEISPITGDTDYSFFLPQLHLKYALADNTNLRFAVTRSYARPNFQDIVPSQEIEFSAREGTIGNTRLKPVGATNIDLLAEHYFGSVGVLSGGIFYKRLNDFIFNRRFETTNYPGAEGIRLALTQAQNGDDASLTGFEVAYQQNLIFLPGLLKGFSLYANYTFTSSQAKIQSRQHSAIQEEIRLPGQARHVGNLSLGYEWKRFNVRLSANFNGEYISEVGATADKDVYIEDRVQVDATATYAAHSRLRVFAEFLNITNQPFEVFQGSASHYIQREFYSWWTRVGVKFDL